MADISLTASMRSNLLSLQNTQSLMDQTQERLSTGKKVNSAIDNPSSYYTSQSLTNRASDLSALLDSMGQGIQTLSAANEGIETITSFVQQAKSVANSARDIANNMKTKVSSTRDVKEDDLVGEGKIYVDTRDDKTTTTATLTDIDTAYTGTGATGSASFSIDVMIDGEAETVSVTQALDIDGGDTTITQESIQAAFDTKFGADKFDIALAGEALTVTSVDGSSVMITGYTQPTSTSSTGTVAGGPTGNDFTQDANIETIDTTAGMTVQQVINELNGYQKKLDGVNDVAVVTAEIDPDTNKLVIKATEASDEAGIEINIATVIPESKVLQGLDGKIETRASDEDAIEQRNKYVSQFNEILTQIDQLAKDASYKGINLLQENDLKVVFNEDRSSTIEIKGVDASSKGLGLEAIEKDGWNLDKDIDETITYVEDAVNELRTMASDFGNNYSIVQTREDFTENLINVLEEGSDKLVLADMNEEGANMLALQTRQQLAVNSLSLASQASQAVLQLFG